MKADLHIHSTVSDGSDSIDKLIEMAVEKGLTHIAITDHDTLSHQKQVPTKKDLQILCGVEISAFDPVDKKKVHILGYGIKEAQYIERLCTPLLEARHANSMKQISILNQHGYHLDVQDIQKADGKYIYKQHIMYSLVKSGQVGDLFGNFYQTIFKNGGICDFDIAYIPVMDAIRAVKDSGGIAVLAHPGQQKNFNLIESLVNCGLDGVEINHPSNNESDREVIKSLAEQYNLLLTGGSDYHGVFEAQKVDMGEYLSPTSCIDTIFRF